MATLITVILDESGSMQIKVDDVIGGFNRFLDDQKAGPDECRLSLTKFNTRCTVVHGALPIKDVLALTAKTYTPGGNTALLDAVAESVRLADKDKRVEDRVLCMIVTDGQENSSRETTLEQVRTIIKEREARGDWTFTYLGADPAQFSKESGMPVANAAAYDPSQPKAMFASASAAAHTYRASSDRQSKNFYQR